MTMTMTMTISMMPGIGVLRAPAIVLLACAVGAALSSAPVHPERAEGAAERGGGGRIGSVVEHNPHGVEVTKIHMVLSSHFDAGCKTPYCGVTRPGEAKVCAKVGVSYFGTGEPWAYNIVNRYFDEFIPRAIELAETARSQGIVYNYMTQSWVLSLYLDCERAGMLNWPGNGAEATGKPTLHCPNASSVAALRAALKRGDIFFHAFAHDGEASTYPDSSLFEAGIEIGERIADDIGIPRPRSVSQRDVPGWTRATIPILAKHNITGVSFGAGVPPGKVDVPPLSVWRDVASGTEVVLTYETGYGQETTLFVLPSGEALCVAWEGDNTGPGPIKDVESFYTALRTRYPGADVAASTFDSFFDAANVPSVKAQLPVVTQEIEDGWIYGVPSDPLKNAQFREATRQRTACVTSGKCSKSSPALNAFDRLLVKIPEHTWGVAQGWFFPDYENYTNAQFDKARAQQVHGFVADNAKHADYNTTVNSWIEQRAFITQAPDLLKSDYPELGASIAKALDDLKTVTPPDVDSLTPVKQLNNRFTCDGIQLEVGAGGGFVSFIIGGKEWAGPNNPIARFLYESYDDADYNIFLKDFGSRIGDEGVWPYHTPGHYADYTNTTSDEGCGNFCKKNMSSANPTHRSLLPTVTGVWKDDSNGSCTVVINSSLPMEAHENAGAPLNVMIKMVASPDLKTFDWEVYQLNKRPTRLPESIFFTFNPVVPDYRGWDLTVLGSSMDPTDVLGKVVKGPDPNATYLNSIYGGSPHLRGVESASYKSHTSDSFTLSSLDVPILCTGKATPFISPRTGPPDMNAGVSWNIFQNIWNTNYVLWYPYEDEDKHIKSRFRLQFN